MSKIIVHNIDELELSKILPYVADADKETYGLKKGHFTHLEYKGGIGVQVHQQKTCKTFFVWEV